MPIDFPSLASRLLSNAAALLPAWFPAGVVRGKEFLVGDLSGKPGTSLSINMETGVWKDFANGDTGGDLINLYAAKQRISQSDAARELDSTPAAPAIRKPAKDKRIVLMPVPDNAPVCPCHHYRHGKPSAIWTYRDAAGKLLGYIARYDIDGKKEIIPWTFATNAKGENARWAAGAWPRPRPLYGLDDLAARPTAPVMVVEGEKAANSARRIATQYVVVTWPGGVDGREFADFKPLYGRTVLLWPDSDKPGVDAMWWIGYMLLLHCPQVKILLPAGKPDKWDAADAVDEGWKWPEFKAWAVPLLQELREDNRPAVPPAETKPPDSETKPTKTETKPKKTETKVVTNETAKPDKPGAALRDRQIYWYEWHLDLTAKGIPLHNLNNAVTILENDPLLKGTIWYDEFLGQILTNGNDGPRQWVDADDIHLALDFQRRHGITQMSTDTVYKAVVDTAMRDVRNCVKDWIATLTWDKEPRIEHFFEDHFGAAANVYTRAASKNFWLSICARVFRPGCKVDNMIVLEGNQGIKKGTALEVIAGKWFAEQHESASNPKAFAEVIQGVLITEIVEMDSFTRSEVQRVKGVVSCRTDRYREPWARVAAAHPRQGIFVGTTNRDDWNKDETGARRFWPIRVEGEVDVAAIAAARDQLFAEAAFRQQAGEPHWVMPELETLVEQEKRYDADPWADAITEWVDAKSVVTIPEILTECLKFAVGDFGQREQIRVAGTLRHLKWVRRLERDGTRVGRVWRPPLNGNGNGPEQMELP